MMNDIRKRRTRNTNQYIDKVHHAPTKTKQVASKETTLIVSITARWDTHLSSVREGLKLSAITAISLGMKQSFVRTKLSSRMQMLKL